MHNRQPRTLRPLLATLLGVLAGVVFMVLCSRFTAFSAFWLSAVIRPVSAFLSEFTSKAPFPIMEWIVVLLGAGVLTGLVGSLSRCIRCRIGHPLGRFAVHTARLTAALFLVYVLLWYPAYWASPSQSLAASTDQVEQLCYALIDELNDSQLRFSDPQSALPKATRAASAHMGREFPQNAVKLARYPEWMEFFGISGIYFPWTGEAIINPNNAWAANAFTACHELMHLSGIADEGDANIAAYIACKGAGGEAAASANLWALRYSMTALKRTDERAWRECTERMNYSVVEAFSSMNGFEPLKQREPGALDCVLAAVGLGESTANYDALVGWLVGNAENFLG
jgi:hypothetical protein